MHEMSLAEGIVRILEQEAANQGFTRVKIVWLELGELSHVSPEAMEFCFDAVTRTTLAEGARLEIIRVPGTAWCMACAEPITITNRVDGCPKCGGHQLQITGGEDMRLKELEVE